MEANKHIAENRPRPIIGNILTFLAVYGLALFFLAYGLKCIIVAEGKLMEPGKYVMGSVRFVAVSGRAAVLTGVGYLALALAACLATFRRRDVRSALVWLGCCAGFVVSFAVAVFFWHRAHELRIR